MPVATTIDVPLLHLLLDSHRPMTVQAIALRRGLPPQQCVHALQQLRDTGCVLNEHPQHGIELVRAGLGTWVDYLEPLVPGRVVLYRQTTSTQDHARQMGAAGDGNYVLADTQTRGRGRLGRSWIAPPSSGALLSRVLALDNRHAPHAVDRLTFAISVAVAQAMDVFVGPGRARIKWPNDILVDGRKLAGILVETVDGAAIVGVGINVNLQADALPSSLQHQVTSLAMLRASADRLRVLSEVILAIEAVLKTNQRTALLDAWRSRCTFLNQVIHLRHHSRDIVGTVIDLDPRDGLIVRTTAGQLVHLPSSSTTVA